MTRWIPALALIAVAAAGCSNGYTPPPSGSTVPQARCLNEPGRSGSYSQDRPLFYLFCVQTP